MGALSTHERVYPRLRARALDALGGCCKGCGNDDPDVLQIDHVNGGGFAERSTTKRGTPYLRHVLAEVAANSGKFQLLCANCNWKKRAERREVRRA